MLTFPNEARTAFNEAPPSYTDPTLSFMHGKSIGTYRLRNDTPCLRNFKPKQMLRYAFHLAFSFATRFSFIPARGANSELDRIGQ